MLCRQIARCPSRHLNRWPSLCVFQRHVSQGVKRIENLAALLKNPEKSSANEILVEGHIRTVRNQKRQSFLALGDGSTTKTLQALLNPRQAAGLSTGTAVRISGAWQPSPAKSQQSHELVASNIEVIGTSDAEKKYHSPAFLRTIPHLRLRLPVNALIARLRSEVEYNVATYFRRNHYVRVHPPIITGADAEGAGETLKIAQLHVSDESPNEYFRGSQHLSVSSQLHLEAFVHEHPRVWTMSPTFRAEKSDTPRHLSEFYMMEAELRCDSLSQIMDHVEALLRDIVHKLRPDILEELLHAKHVTNDHENEPGQRATLLIARWEGLQRQYWPRVTYSDAMKLLQAASKTKNVEFQYPPDSGSGLQLEHEKFLANEIGQGGPIFITHYPQHLKPFYMLPDGNDTVACFDLLLPDMAEIAGGSLREHRANCLEPIMQQKGLLRTNEVSTGGDLSWYLDLRKYGSVPHGGYGLGFDRLIGYLVGIDNVRDIVAWPRYYGHCEG